jgi:hypothetical protein
MATLQMDGVTSVTSTSTVNNSGVVKNISTSDLLKKSDLGRPNVTSVGSVVVDSTNTDKAVSAGVFSYNNQLPVAKRLTTSLSTVSNTVLSSGAAQPTLVKSVHKLLVKNNSNNLVDGIRTYKIATAIRSGLFNIYTGKFTSSPTVSVDEFAEDSVGNASRSNQGSLVYRTGSRSVTSQNYPSKTA